MTDEPEESPVLTEAGWLVVETIERMMKLNFTVSDICDALDITPDLMQLMLFQGNLERTNLEWDIRDVSG